MIGNVYIDIFFFGAFFFKTSIAIRKEKNNTLAENIINILFEHARD